MNLEQKSWIGTLTIHGVDVDDPALRLAVSNQVSALDIQPPAMPPSSILIVKRLADPDPGGIRRVNLAFDLNREWETALNARLDNAYYAASSPHDGVLPSDAEAVQFVDEAQMLACLLMDLVSGQVHGRWWWRQFSVADTLSGNPSVQASRICHEHIEALPAAIEQLKVWRCLDDVLAAIDAGDAMSIALELCRCHGLPDWGELLISVNSDKPPGTLPANKFSSGNLQAMSERPDETTSGSALPDSGQASQVPAFSDPWPRWLGSSFKRSPQHRLVMGLGLMLYQQPWILRQTAFRQDVLHWYRSATQRFSDGSVQVPGDGLLSGRNLMPSDNAGENIAAAIEGTDDKHAETKPEAGGESRQTAFGDLDSGNPATYPVAQRSDADRHQRQVDPLAGLSIGSDKTAVTSHDKRGFETSTVTGRKQSGFNGKTIATELGGIFYLINLIERLQLPECFESEWGMASRLSRWALLEVLAKSLLGQDFACFADDAIWAFLASLDGRDTETEPGEQLNAAQVYVLPQQWRQFLSGTETRFHWAATQRVLRLWQANAFILAQTPRTNLPAKTQAKRLLQRYLDGSGDCILSRSAFDQAPLAQVGFPCHENLKRWLSLAMPALQASLQILLAPGSGADAGRIKQLLYCPGQIYVTATHIDFVSVLERISLQARACGLDRDPGWMPEYSRCVKFYFN